MSTPPNNPTPAPQSSSTGLLIFAWLVVGLPLAWGVTQTIGKAMALFH